MANSLAGIRNGARQVEGTINGIGERAGNAALEEIVMGIRTRADYYGVSTGVDAREFFRTSRMVADMLESPSQPIKPSSDRMPLRIVRASTWTAS